MDRDRATAGHGFRLLGRYLGASLLPLLALMLALPVGLHYVAADRGLAQARTEATLLAQTAVEPILSAAPLTHPVGTAQKAALDRMSAHAASDGTILRLRVRSMNGKVAYADDGDDSAKPEEEVGDALAGRTSSSLTRLNADAGERHPLGVRAVEVYQPLREGDDHHVVGVLEVYLPYAPIQADVQRGLMMLTVVGLVGLALLYLVLALISASVTRRLRRQAAENAYLAAYDPLTGLPNRVSFLRAVDRAVDEAAGTGTAIAVCTLDLEGFREVNETLGHEHGDSVLRLVGDRLQDRLRPGELLARLAGDEYAVLMTGLEPGSAADTSGARVGALQQALVEELSVGGIPLALEAAAGVAVSAGGPDEPTGSELVRRADVALDHARAAHRPLVAYAQTLDQFDATRLGLLAQLRRGIDAGELVLHYQPKISVPDGRVHAAEALLRWARPDGTLLLPGAFLDAAESTGLIEPLTAWVVGEAVRQVAAWGEALADLTVAINVSARNLSQPGFADTVLRRIAAAGVAPERLVVEITETALVEEPETAVEALRRLDAAGVAVSIDDFGRGQTSLAYLATLPVRELKIDRSLVDGMAGSVAARAIVRSMVDLGHHLGLRVVAEGVSTPEAYQRLSDLGCDLVQGWLFAPALAPDELAAWVATRHAGDDGAPRVGPEGATLARGLG